MRKQEKTPLFGQFCDQLGFAHQTVTLGNLPDPIPEGTTAIIVSGAPILVTEIDPTPYLEQFHFLKTTSLPVLGVCFGHQILGMLHGATQLRCPEDRSWQSIRIQEKGILFDGFEASVNMFEDHCEAISLPDNFQLLASSAICEVEAMQHTSKKLFGVQFHPEASESKGLQLIGNFLNTI